MIALRLLIIPILIWAQSERSAADRCETKPRLCFQKCLDRDGSPPVCNRTCSTARCDGMAGRDQSLTEFLKARRNGEGTWL